MLLALFPIGEKMFVKKMCDYVDRKDNATAVQEPVLWTSVVTSG